MKLRLEDRNQAIDLRTEGKTYREIMSIIPNLSKSTLSSWLRNVKLTAEQEKKLAKNIEEINYNARVKAAWTKKQRSISREKYIIEQARKESISLLQNHLFLAGVVFYWAEGMRKGYFNFSNSDPVVIRIMIEWLTKIHKIPKKNIKIRIFIHKIYAHENCEDYWSRITGIPVDEFEKTIYKPTPHKVKKNREYKGCVQIKVYNSDFLRKIKGWQKGLADFFNVCPRS